MTRTRLAVGLLATGVVLLAHGGRPSWGTGTAVAQEASAIALVSCVGDCNRDGSVTTSEAILLVNISLGETSVDSCHSLVQTPLIHDLIRAVSNLLFGCTRPIRYGLVEGSTITFTPPPPGASPSVPEPLSGTFTVIECAAPPPNTVFLFNITSLEFQGGSRFAVTGLAELSLLCRDEKSVGDIEALTIAWDRQLSMYALVSINGEEVVLHGTGPIDYENDPPTFQNLRACGGAPGLYVDCYGIDAGTDSGYELVIFAVPEG